VASAASTSATSTPASALQAIGRGLARLPGVATPNRSAPTLASMALDDRCAPAPSSSAAG
jgi:hypothetical protein